MHRGWVLGLTLYMAFFAITIGLRWRQVDQPYTDFDMDHRAFAAHR